MTPAPSVPLSIGWAQRDVTPDRPVNLCGQFHPRIARSARDPVTVTALALSAGRAPADGVIFVSCDTALISPDVQERCRQALRTRVPDLDPAILVMNATHTHTAPQLADFWYPPQGPEVMTPNEYADLFVARAADAAAAAWQARRPGACAWAFGYAVVSHNRRVVYFDDLSKRPGAKPLPGGYRNGKAAMYGATADAQFSHMEGYVDHALDLLFTWNAAGALTGLVVNLACPSQETEGESLISADFWHDIRVALRARHGAGLFVLPQCSAAGDLSPHPLLHRKAEERMLKLAGRSRREEIARRVDQAVADALPLAEKDRVACAPLRHLVRTVRLPRRRITVEEIAAIRADLARMEARGPGEKPVPESMRNRCREALERYARQDAAPVSTEELHVVRLGDVVFATNRFELFLDYGLRIKARSPALQTFVVQLAAGDFLEGTYLPTARAAEGGGYSAGLFDNEIGPEGGQVLVEETLKTIGEAMAP